MGRTRPCREKYQVIEKAKEQLDCHDLIIPINDEQSWIHHQPWRDVYNRQKLAEFQGLYHAMMPAKPLPNKYPVVLKPVTNLYGMGHESYLIHNEEELRERWGHTGFWMEYLEGTHYSYDLILCNGQVQWWICFQGEYLKDETTGEKIHGVFDHWRCLGQLNRGDSLYGELPKCLYSYIERFCQGYSGCFNVEFIGDKMIECHLRMGDQDQFDDDLLIKLIVQAYRGDDNNLGTYQPLPVHLFPIWGRKIIKKSRIIKDIIAICNRHKITRYLIENGRMSGPPGELKRILMLTASNFSLGQRAQQKIKDLLDSNGYLSKNHGIKK